jgi:hypothetical protein
MPSVQTRTDVTIRRLVLSGEPKSIDDAVFAQASAATAGNVTDTTTYAVADQDGLNFQVTIDGGTAQTITFSGATTTAASVAAQINTQIIGGYAEETGGQVKITSDTVGVGSSVAITAGTSALTWAAPVAGTGGIELAEYTVVAKNPADEKWYPLTDVTATDGTEFPRGVYIGPGISAADLGAADVTDQRVMVNGDITMNEDLLVLQNGIALSDEITNQNITVRSALTSIGLNPEKTEFVPGVENS